MSFHLSSSSLDSDESKSELPPEEYVQAAFVRGPDGRLGKDISSPFNFKHEIHVDARFSGFPGSWRYTGLPASWAAALATQPPSPTTLDPPPPPRKPPFALPSFKNLSPSQRWNKVWTSWTIRFYPHPQEDENISQPFNFKHEVHAESKYTPSWHAALILSAEESWRTALSLSQQQRSTKMPKKRFHIHLPTFSMSFPKPSRTTTKAGSSDGGGGGEISLPWNFQHNIHVDEKYNGLPPSWATILKSQGFTISRPTSLCCPHVCTAR